MRKEFWLNHQNKKKEMQIKFHENYTIDRQVTFLRNSIWEYLDKYEFVDTDPCTDCADKIKWKFRLQVDGVIYTIPGTYIAELSDAEAEIYNNDYTHPAWNQKITTDAYVEDGNYVKAWKETFNIADPVKKRADQSDYRGEWYETKRRIDKRYGGSS